MHVGSSNLLHQLETQANELTGLSSTSSSKYDDFKKWLHDRFEAAPAVCFLSDPSKQWAARVGQALVAMPRLLVLLVHGESKVELPHRLEGIHRYATGLHATIVLTGSEGAWKYSLLTGSPGHALYEQLAVGLRTATDGPAPPGAEDKGGEAPPPNPPGVATIRPAEFLALESTDQADLVWRYLIGTGARDVDEAIREVAHQLRDDARATFERLRRDGPLYSSVERALAACTRRGVLFDRPGRGQVRAVLRDPDDFTRDHWRDCLRRAALDRWVPRNELVRQAATVAVEAYGLDLQRFRTGGRVDSAIRGALNGLIRLGELERNGPQLVRRTQLAKHASARPPEVGKTSVDIEAGVAHNSHGPDGPKADAGTPTLDTRASSLRALVGELPGECEAAFADFLTIELRTVAELGDAVDAHLAEFESAFSRHEFLDLDGAERLAAASHDLLGRWPEMSDSQRRLAQAAILYFIDSDEADDDFRPGGLRTDRAVFSAVEAALATRPEVPSVPVGTAIDTPL